MSADINEQLMARLHAVRAAFYDPNLADKLNSMVMETPKPNAAKHWRDVLQEDDSGDGSGGGGTIKGLRGKDAEYAKQAMRKLTRNR